MLSSLQRLWHENLCFRTHYPWKATQAIIVIPFRDSAKLDGRVLNSDTDLISLDWTLKWNSTSWIKQLAFNKVLHEQCVFLCKWEEASSSDFTTLPCKRCHCGFGNKLDFRLPYSRGAHWEKHRLSLLGLWTFTNLICAHEHHALHGYGAFIETRQRYIIGKQNFLFIAC